MRNAMLVLAGLSVMLSACGDKGEKGAPAGSEIGATDAMSKAQVKEAVDKVQLKPGQWEGSYALDDIDLSGMSGATAQMKDQMKAMMSRTGFRYCVTPEQAANPSGGMFAGQENKDCTYAGFDASGGRVKGQVSCKAQGGAMHATMDGRYASESYEMMMDIRTEGGPQGLSMAMKARSTGKWIGATCDKS